MYVPSGRSRRLCARHEVVVGGGEFGVRRRGLRVCPHAHVGNGGGRVHRRRPRSGRRGDGADGAAAAHASAAVALGARVSFRAAVGGAVGERRVSAVHGEGSMEDRQRGHHHLRVLRGRNVLAEASNVMAARARQGP